MAIERTLSIIKPDATRRNLTGRIAAKFEAGGAADRRLQAHPADPGAGRAVLRGPQGAAVLRELTTFMASGPVVVQVLEGEGAVLKNREVMGATNPKDAAPGTIRAEFAESVGENSVHGSDAPETAREEIAFFFSGLELVG
jgi:nucleoside-diphosphate kinase